MPLAAAVPASPIKCCAPMFEENIDPATGKNIIVLDARKKSPAACWVSFRLLFHQPYNEIKIPKQMIQAKYPPRMP